MNLHNVYSKLQHARNLLMEGMAVDDVDYRVVLAELDDVLRDIERELTDMAKFPLTCSCEKKGTPQEHKETTHRAAEQAYHNLRRYYKASPENPTLTEIEQKGGFDCVDIRALLFGLNPYNLKNREEFSKQHPDIKVETNGH